MTGPKIIAINEFLDDRGNLSFSNDEIWSFFNIKRFYFVSNNNINFIRAWHGHCEESKIFIPIIGNFKIGLPKLSILDQKDVYDGRKQVWLKNDPEIFYLNPNKMLFIPKGYANGFMNLMAENKLLVLSDKTLDESKGDDYRFEWNYFENFWKIEYR